jgi:TonB family protein
VASRDKDRSSLNYAASIGISAAAHAVVLYLFLFALPRWLKPDETPPPAYTVTIVDNLPAGDLGTHLPRFKDHRIPTIEESRHEEKAQEQKERKEPNNTKIEAPNTDVNALALNTHPTEAPTPEPTPTPTPEPVETPEPTPEPTAAPTQPPTAEPTHRPTVRPEPTPRPHPEALREHHRHKQPAPKVRPRVMIAAATPKAARTPTVKERLARLREQLMKEHLQQLAKAEKTRAAAEPDEDSDETETGERTASREPGGGPVLGTSASAGRGAGVGSGTGSLGMLRDPQFLLYYQSVQERIKNAWSFAGGNKDLTTTVKFAIGPDGKLTGLAVARSSNNESFDQSVLRAIRRASPFPPPPEQYRDQFAQGVQAVFKMGELNS